MTTAIAPKGGKRPFIMRKGVSVLSDLADGLTSGSLLGHGGGVAYYLDPTNGNDGNDGLHPDTAVKTLPVAYALLTDGNNDVLYYMAGTSSISLSAEFTWAKSYTHFIGVCAPTFTGQRARIFATAGNLDLTPLILISGSGCTWANLRIYHGVDDADALVAVEVTGDYNSFINCQFAGGGHASNAIDGCASLKLNGAGENYFGHCSFGTTTIAGATGASVILFDTNSVRNVFEDCLVAMRAGDTAANLVEVVDATGIEDYQLWKNCIFLSTSANQATQMASAFVIPASVATFARMYMIGCTGTNFAKWDANDRGILYGDMNDVTGADTSGVAVEMIS